MWLSCDQYMVWCDLCDNNTVIMWLSCDLCDNTIIMWLSCDLQGDCTEREVQDTISRIWNIISTLDTDDFGKPQFPEVYWVIQNLTQKITFLLCWIFPSSWICRREHCWVRTHLHYAVLDPTRLSYPLLCKSCDRHVIILLSCDIMYIYIYILWL